MESRLSTVSLRRIACLCAWLVVQILAFTAPGQPGAGASSDPLVALMMSQPSISLTGPVQVTAEFDPPKVRIGDLAVYRVTLVAIQDSIEWPENIPAPSELNLRSGAQGNILVPSGTNIEARTTFVYRARPTKAGIYTVPAFDAQVYGKAVRVPEARVEVVPQGMPAGQAQTLRLDVPSTNVYVGQGVRVKVMLPFTVPASQSLSGVQLTGSEGQGFLVDQTAVRQRIEPVQVGGSNQITYIYETLVTPISPGRVRFYAQGWSTINRATGPVYITNNMVMNLITTYLMLDSDPTELQVKPLPQGGQLPGFVGAVGLYTNDPPALSTNVVRAGDPIKMRVTFRGEGNIARLVPPPAPSSDQWQVFEASGDPTAPQMIHAQGAITFTYTLIPLTPDARETPALPYSSFDPASGRFVDLTIRPVPVRVVAPSAAIDMDAIAAANASQAPSEQAPRLSDLAPAPGLATASLEPLQDRPWFPLVQIAPAAFFLGLYLWDRRRRYLLAHPEIVLRARGLKMLRKHRRAMTQAWANGDGAGYAREAVAALRAGSSPHFPALPRALVGMDILGALSEEARNAPAGDAVRSLFGILDNASYAPEHGQTEPILREKENLDAALNDLEQQLTQCKEGLPADGGLKTAVVAKAIGGLVLFASVSPTACLGGIEQKWSDATNAYSLGRYEAAAVQFRSIASGHPSSGVFQNLGLAEWHSGRPGPAILAWEQALWIDPFNRAAAQNLTYARHAAQLSSPELAWYEVPSTWLPANWWPWLTGGGLWLAVGALLLPGLMGEKRAAWQQGVAALGFTVFLICIPAQMGIHTRTRLGFILEKETPLRLTPTRNAQVVMRLAAGEPARVRGARGTYVFVRSASSAGWIAKSELGLVTDPSAVAAQAEPKPQAIALTSRLTSR